MIKDLRKLKRGGYYVGDFRYDEGVRIREDYISPCLCASNGNDKGLSGMVLLIEVRNEKTKSEECD